MWGNKKQSAKLDTVVAEGTEIKGDIVFKGNLFVDGEIQGDINCASDEQSVVTVGYNGLVKGQINAPYVVAYGSVDGDVHASQGLKLKPGSKINGDLHYRLIEMNEGAQVNGKMLALGEQRAIEHKPSAKPEDNKETSKEINEELSKEKEPVSGKE